MSRFIKATRMLYVMCVLLACRAWLYGEYFAVHGESTTAQVVRIAFIIFLVYMIKTLRMAYKKQEMVTCGLYRIVAHPAYAVYVAIDIPLWFLAPHSPFAIATGILLYVVILITAYLEEDAIMWRFGDKARGYYNRTLSVHFLLSLMGIRK